MLWIIVIVAVIAWLLHIRGKLHSLNDDSKLEELDQSGDYVVDVVGESNYQDGISASVRERNEKGVRIITEAIVWLDDDNEYDKKAVCVEIGKRTVGYLSREDARAFRKYIKAEGISGDEWKVPAMIIGGKKRGDEWLSYGVKLDLPIGDD